MVHKIFDIEYQKKSISIKLYLYIINLMIKSKSIILINSIKFMKIKFMFDLYLIKFYHKIYD